MPNQEDSIDELDLEEEGNTTSGVAIDNYKGSLIASPVVSQVHYYMDSIRRESGNGGDTSLYSGGGLASSGRATSGVANKRDNRFREHYSGAFAPGGAQSTGYRNNNHSDESRKTAGPPASSMAKSGSTMAGTHQIVSTTSKRTGMSPIISNLRHEEERSHLSTSPKHKANNLKGT